ncbi:hypothetical protein RF11_00729 [Thelohanellus kitauei]|uniref:Uncharacterized protein n=1 Tax=Thelohanellus kitauei TaxID=669202 RepID=A0A0C2NEB9_THEKT|nr:hypothetical protein RF11_00729 [Thelohanellus kitauei]
MVRLVSCSKLSFSMLFLVVQAFVLPSVVSFYNYYAVPHMAHHVFYPFQEFYHPEHNGPIALGRNPASLIVPSASPVVSAENSISSDLSSKGKDDTPSQGGHHRRHHFSRRHAHNILTRDLLSTVDRLMMHTHPVERGVYLDQMQPIMDQLQLLYHHGAPPSHTNDNVVMVVMPPESFNPFSKALTGPVASFDQAPSDANGPQQPVTETKPSAPGVDVVGGTPLAPVQVTPSSASPLPSQEMVGQNNFMASLYQQQSGQAVSPPQIVSSYITQQKEPQSAAQQPTTVQEFVALQQLEALKKPILPPQTDAEEALAASLEGLTPDVAHAIEATDPEFASMLRSAHEHGINFVNRSDVSKQPAYGLNLDVAETFTAALEAVYPHVAQDLEDRNPAIASLSKAAHERGLNLVKHPHASQQQAVDKPEAAEALALSMANLHPDLVHGMEVDDPQFASLLKSARVHGVQYGDHQGAHPETEEENEELLAAALEDLSPDFARVLEAKDYKLASGAKAAHEHHLHFGKKLGGKPEEPKKPKMQNNDWDV